MVEDIRNAHEKYHYNRICSFFDPTVIRLILSNTACDYEKELRSMLDKEFVPSERTIYSNRLADALSATRTFFRLKNRIQLYVDESGTNSVKTYPSTGPGAGNYIVVSQFLMERLKVQELLFLIGHEASHIVFRHAVVNWIIDTVYPESHDIPPVIANEWNIWILLAELSSDNAGLKICGDKEAAVSALKKAVPETTPGLSDRILCIGDEDKAEEYYKDIIARLSKDYPGSYADFLEKAAVFVSRLDGSLHVEEEEFILNRLSRHHYLESSRVFCNVEIKLDDIIRQGKETADLYPDKTKEIFLNLSALSLRDNRLTPKEYDTLSLIGSEAFGFSPKTIDSLFLSIIRSNCFQPYDEL